MNQVMILSPPGMPLLCGALAIKKCEAFYPQGSENCTETIDILPN